MREFLPDCRETSPMGVPANENHARFTCTECERYVVDLYDLSGRTKLCALCLLLPGWRGTSTIRAAIEPDRRPA